VPTKPLAIAGSPTWQLFAREAWRRCLHDRGGSREALGGIRRARRVDPLPVDQALGLLGRGAGHGDPAVPALGVERAPGAEIETGDVTTARDQDAVPGELLLCVVGRVNPSASGQPIRDLAPGTDSYQPNFVPTRLNRKENSLKSLAT
jgi:hypothetical protein